MLVHGGGGCRRGGRGSGRGGDVLSDSRGVAVFHCLTVWLRDPTTKMDVGFFYGRKLT